MQFTKLKYAICLCTLLSIKIFAAIPAWQIIPAKSFLTFTATQNGAPVTGEFKQFTGNIIFDPAHPDLSQFKININMHSLKTAYAELTSTLLSADWFNADKYPDATFDLTKLEKIDDKNYKALGNFTLKGKIAPITLVLELKNYSDKAAVMHGTTTLKRTNFNVGMGEWLSTAEVKDDVKVDFEVAAVVKTST